MGIEPTLSAWEAEVLPLNYARPVPKDGRLPRRAVPSGWVGSRPVSRQATTRKSAPFRVGAIVASPIRTVTARHSLAPRSSTRSSCARSYNRNLSHVAVRHHYGLTLFRAASTCREDPAFLPVIVLSACSHQAGKHPITYCFGQSLSVDLAHSSLTAFISGSLDIGPSTQPSASSGFRLPESRAQPHGCGVPEGGCIVGALGTESLPTPHCT